MPLDDMQLLVEFENGEQRRYNVRQLYSTFPVFRDLERESLFPCVQVDAGGYGISWNDYIDLSCNELWDNGVPTQ